MATRKMSFATGIPQAADTPAPSMKTLSRGSLMGLFFITIGDQRREISIRPGKMPWLGTMRAQSYPRGTHVSICEKVPGAPLYNQLGRSAIGIEIEQFQSTHLHGMRRSRLTA